MGSHWSFCRFGPVLSQCRCRTLFCWRFVSKSLLYEIISDFNQLSLIHFFSIAIIFKKILKHPRPDHSRKKSHGMPSSHAQSLSFFSGFLTLLLLQHDPWPYFLRFVVAVSLNAFIFAAIYVRYVAQYHSIPQLIVGVWIGSSFGLLWYPVVFYSGLKPYILSITGTTIFGIDVS